ncbi:transporter [Lapidilactobacillus concavus]|nr:flippase [Lapidilactobacillus concavus]GEL13680.1 transporter [Lapidilactobacillus concavus]
MENKSISKNAILNILRVSVGLLFPLITFPYATRVLQVVNLGKVNFSNSIVSYFVLIASLGVSSYGVREGARLRNDKKFGAFVSEVFSLNVVTTIASYLLLFLAFVISAKMRSYFVVILIQSLSIMFTTLGIDWVNAIFEDYLYITIRSLIVQVISLVFLFLFVKSPSDYLLYAAMTVLSNGIICVANLIYCRRYVHLRIRFNSKMFTHLKPMLIFFSNNMAVTVYVSSDMTILGWLAGDYYSGLYAVSVKIYQTIKQVLTALYVVTIPRLALYAGDEDTTRFKKLFTDISNTIILVILPAIAGLICLSGEIILLISGKSFIKATLSLQILSVGLLFAVASGVIVNCFNTPMRQEKISLHGTVLAAILNIGLNFFFIPHFLQNGASITTVIAEASTFLYCIIRERKLISRYIEGRSMIQQFIVGLIGAALVIVINTIITWFSVGSMVHLILTIMISPVAYLVFLILIKNKYVVPILKRVGLKK